MLLSETAIARNIQQPNAIVQNSSPMDKLWKAAINRRYVANATQQLLLHNCSSEELSTWANFSDSRPLQRIPNFDAALNNPHVAKYSCALLYGSTELTNAYRKFIESLHNRRYSELQLRFAKIELEIKEEYISKKLIEADIARAQRELDASNEDVQKQRKELLNISGEEAVKELENGLSENNS